MTILISVGTCWLSIGSQAGSGVLVGLFHCLGVLGSIPSCGARGVLWGAGVVWGVGEVILLQRE